MTTYDQDIAELLKLSQMLTKFLEDPHPGLHTWVAAVSASVDKMHAIIHPPKSEPMFENDFFKPKI